MAALAPLDIVALGTMSRPAVPAAAPTDRLQQQQQHHHHHRQQQQREPVAPSPSESSLDLSNHAPGTAGPAPSPATTAASSSTSSSGARQRPTAAAPSTTTESAWTPAEDETLRLAVKVEGARNWKTIAADYFGGRFSDTQCLHRWQKVLRPGLVKGPWTKEEDAVIICCMAQGITKWSLIAERVPGRLGKQCRERWLNHLDPAIKKTGWTAEEDAALIAAHATLGNAWCLIASALPGRSENAVKNRWHSAAFTRLRARLAQQQQQHPHEATVEQPAIPPPVAAPAAAAAITTQQQQRLPMNAAAQKDEEPPTPFKPLQQRGHDDMESISSISSASTASMAESESESEAEDKEEQQQVQRSQLPPRHRGLQHHATQHAGAPSPMAAEPAVVTKRTVTPHAPSGFAGLAGLALAASALCTTPMTTATPPVPAPHLPQLLPPPLPQQQHAQQSQHMRATISLLFAAMRGEADSTRRALIQDALDAATQEHPAMANFIGGVLGGASIDLAVEGDRYFLLDQILAATHRGVFGPRTFRL